MKALKSSPIIGIVVGIFIAIVSTYLLSYTSAIAAPKAPFNETKIISPATGLIVWDFLVVQLLGSGVVAALATYLVTQYSTTNWLCSLIASSELLCVWVILPLMASQKVIVTQLMWWQHSHTIVILLSVFAAGYLTQIKKAMNIEQQS